MYKMTSHIIKYCTEIVLYNNSCVFDGKFLYKGNISKSRCIKINYNNCTVETRKNYVNFVWKYAQDPSV